MYFKRNRACVVGTEVRKFINMIHFLKWNILICTIKVKAFFSVLMILLGNVMYQVCDKN